MKIKIVVMVLVIVVVAGAVIFFWLSSGSKITPGIVSDSQQNRFKPATTVKAVVRTTTEWYEAVGTVRPRTEIRIEAQVAAQVRAVSVNPGDAAVSVNPGDAVRQNQVLIKLDNRRYLSRLDQAKQAAIAAKAGFTRAETEYKRIYTYFQAQAATARDLEKAEEVLTSAKAGIMRAEEVVREAEIALGYTIIKAPETGKVLKRLVESGDLAAPGKPLLILETSGTFRLEAHVREGLIKNVKPKTVLRVAIDALQKSTEATVEEIVPYADPATRTFLVKTSLPDLTGLYPGMFGKLLVPVQEHQVIVIPSKAVRHVGQLELVSVKENDIWQTRYIKTGKTMKEMVEVLSGLSGGETIGY
jgi:RND family efflux transporter MFP subunit